MTHKDIYIKFMIEYDKANVTSSYPSLTEYEVATFLDKAYNALIAQKITGNNYRRAGFESDIKSISDLAPLIETRLVSKEVIDEENSVELNTAPNMVYGILPQQEGHEFLYAIEAFVRDDIQTTPMKDRNGNDIRNLMTTPIQIITHEMAHNFMATKHNLPWIKNPVAYIDGGKIYVMYDPIDLPLTDTSYGLWLRYIKKPKKFAKDVSKFSNGSSYFQGDGGSTLFELNETMAEELISLAIGFALENVESPRLNSKLNMRGLEL